MSFSSRHILTWETRLEQVDTISFLFLSFPFWHVLDIPGGAEGEKRKPTFKQKGRGICHHQDTQETSEQGWKQVGVLGSQGTLDLPPIACFGGSLFQ